jgi:hypothetical protein
MRVLAFITGVSVALASCAGAAQASAPARYVLRHPGHEHCGAAYRQTVIHVRRRRHGRRVELRQIVCLRRHAQLTAEIGPAVTQSPDNPLQVTYSYGASAHEASREASLPDGVLNLYSDGQLRCSANVGGGRERSASCAVTYTWFGAHPVTVELRSGAVRADASIEEDIEPFSTSTTLSIVREGCHLTQLFPGVSNVCWNSVEAGTVDRNGIAPPQGGVTIEIEGALPTAQPVTISPADLGQPGPGFEGRVMLLFSEQRGESGIRCRLSYKSASATIWSGPPDVVSTSPCGLLPKARAVYRDADGSWTESASTFTSFYQAEARV